MMRASNKVRKTQFKGANDFSSQWKTFGQNTLSKKCVIIVTDRIKEISFFLPISQTNQGNARLSFEIEIQLVRLSSLVALTLLAGTTSCRCVGSTTRRWGPPSTRSSRWWRRTCIPLSKRSPSSTARRTNSRRQRSSIWTSRIWRAYHWTPHPTPNVRRASVETTAPQWAYGAITRSMCPIRIWTVERKMAEFCLYPDLVRPNVCLSFSSQFFKEKFLNALFLQRPLKIQISGLFCCCCCCRRRRCFCLMVH